MTTIKRPLPHLFNRIRNIGISAAGTADLLYRYRYREPGYSVLGEVIRAAWQNRHVLARDLPGSARYR